MTQEELETLRLAKLQEIAEKYGIKWRNTRGKGLHARKCDLVKAIARRVEKKAPPRLPRRVYRVVRLEDGAVVGIFGSMVYAGIFWRGLCQTNDAARLKFRIEEKWK